MSVNPAQLLGAMLHAALLVPTDDEELREAIRNINPSTAGSTARSLRRIEAIAKTRKGDGAFLFIACRQAAEAYEKEAEENPQAEREQLYKETRRELARVNDALSAFTQSAKAFQTETADSDAEFRAAKQLAGLANDAANGLLALESVLRCLTKNR